MIHPMDRMVKQWNTLFYSSYCGLFILQVLSNYIKIKVLISANDELMRHARIVKSKIFFFLHGNSYLKLKKTRENI